MKRVIILIFSIAALSVMMSSCGLFNKQGSGSKNKNLFETTMDTVSYLIGTEIGTSFKNNHIDIRTAALLKGIEDAAQGQENLFHDTVKDKVMTAFQFRLQMAEMERREQASSLNRQEQENFMKENRKNPEIVETTTGIQYKVIKMGTGEKPVATDTVRVHYEGRFVDGEVFDASRKYGPDPVEFPLNRVIPGWTEALQLMPVGSTYEIYLPSEMAYGERGNDRIPPGKMLIFVVELIDIVKKQP